MTPDNNGQTQLNQEDQNLVDEFLSSGVNQEKRGPFRPWKLMLWLTIIIIIFGVSARLIGTLFLPY